MGYYDDDDGAPDLRTLSKFLHRRNYNYFALGLDSEKHFSHTQYTRRVLKKTRTNCTPPLLPVRVHARCTYTAFVTRVLCKNGTKKKKQNFRPFSRLENL